LNRITIFIIFLMAFGIANGSNLVVAQNAAIVDKCTDHLNSNSARYTSSVKHVSVLEGRTVIKCLLNEGIHSLTYRWCGQKGVVRPNLTAMACNRDLISPQFSNDVLELGANYQDHSIMSHIETADRQQFRSGSLIQNLLHTVESLTYVPVYAALDGRSHTASDIRSFSDNNPDDMLRVSMKMETYASREGDETIVRADCHYTFQIHNKSAINQSTNAQLPLVRVKFNNNWINEQMFGDEGEKIIELGQLNGGTFSFTLTTGEWIIPDDENLILEDVNLLFLDTRGSVIAELPGVSFL